MSASDQSRTPEPLIVLCPRERGLLQHALEQALASPELGDGGWATEEGRDDARRRLSVVLDFVRSKTGGFRLDTGSGEVYWASEMLLWIGYSQENAPERQGWPYTALGFAIRERARIGGIHGVVGFDPETYSSQVPTAAPTYPYRT